MTHRTRQTGHLGRFFALQRKRHQQAPNLRRLCLTVHDGAHRARRFVARQVFVPPQFLQQLGEHDQCVPRKF